MFVDKPSTLTFGDNMTRWLPRRWMDFRWSDFSLTEPRYNFIHTQMQEIKIELIRSGNVLNSVVQNSEVKNRLPFKS